MVKQSLPLFFQVAMEFTQMEDKIQAIWKLGKQGAKKIHWFSIGWVMAMSPKLFSREPVPPWHSTGGWNRDANRHWGPNMKELRSERLNNLFWRPWLPVKQSFPAQLWININTTRGRNSWDWHFITWLSQSQAIPLSHELNKGCPTLPEVCDSKASCILQSFLITTLMW